MILYGASKYQAIPCVDLDPCRKCLRKQFEKCWQTEFSPPFTIVFSGLLKTNLIY